MTGDRTPERSVVGLKTTSASVVFEEVSKSFGPVLAVNKLNLQVAQGEFLVLLGPSGCGKTTSLRMLAGLERISSGTIRIGDTVVNELPPRSRNVAMVFQSYALYPHLSVFDNLAYPLRIRGLPRDSITPRVREVAGLLQIDSLLERRPKQLSGGQRQRVALGRAIVRHPAVFLMDEPLSNLDAQLRVHTRGELKRLQRELSVTTIYVTHDQAEAMTLADRVAIMRDGLLQQIGPPREIYDRPANMFVGAFLGSPGMNFLRGTLTASEDQLSWSANGHALSLPPEWSAAVAGSSSASDVVLGIRPENVTPAEESDSRALPGEVYVSEALGNETLVRLQVAGQELVLRADASFEPEIGARVWVRPDLRRAHLFDAQTETRII
ncbi:MAG: ABC transporter ATP-binding protein [Chloroflexi bacterium]|nr:ABC transporter ATP-binding protein [Chloroflexota bacterium]